MGFREYARALRRRKARSPCLVVLKRIESTHLLARRVVDEYVGEGTPPPASVFVAWEQAAGLGRDGRRWMSPAGLGVYATVVRPLAAERLQALPLLVATALCEAANVHLEGRCRLKWPNDLLVGERKLGGVLIDTLSRGGDAAVGMISFGVNWGRDFSEPRATSFEREVPGETELDGVAAELLEAVEAALESEATEGEVVASYAELSLHRPGEELRLRAVTGEVRGVFRGFDRHGFLRLEVAGEERLLTAGEVAR